MSTGPKTDPGYLAESRGCLSTTIPTDEDKNVLSELLKEAEGDLESLDANIGHIQTALVSVKRRLTSAEGELYHDTDTTRIQTVLLDLMKRRRSSVRRVSRLRAALAPHKKLPEDILAKIFIECADGQRVSVPRRGDCVAWDLSQVCRRWREIARYEGRLWENINAHHSGDSYTFDLLRDVLLHSTCIKPGKVHLKIYPKSHFDWLNLRGLVGHNGPVKGLDLYLDDACLRALSSPTREFDNLEVVSLSFFESPNIFSIPILAFSTAKKIRDVTLNLYGNLRLTDIQKRMLPWTQVMNLTLTNFTSTSVLHILGRCPQLINLTVGLKDSIIQSQTRRSMVSLTDLRTISISHDGEVLNNLLSYLVLPSLQEFRMDGYGTRIFPFDLS